MKKIIVLFIIGFLFFLIVVGCTNNPTTPSTQTSTPTSSPTSQATETETVSPTITPTITPTGTITPTITPTLTATPTPTPTPEETGKLTKVELLETSDQRASATILGGDILHLIFDVELDLDTIYSNATQYIHIYCDKQRDKTWEGLVLVNTNKPGELMIQFASSININCALSKLLVVPIQGRLKVKGGGYIKGIPAGTNNFPDDPSGTHGEAAVKIGTIPHLSEMLQWHEAPTPPAGPVVTVTAPVTPYPVVTTTAPPIQPTGTIPHPGI